MRDELRGEEATLDERHETRGGESLLHVVGLAVGCDAERNLQRSKQVRDSLDRLYLALERLVERLVPFRTEVFGKLLAAHHPRHLDARVARAADERAHHVRGGHRDA